MACSTASSRPRDPILLRRRHAFDPPDYADFVYFSFVIGMTSQVSDVVITNRRIRHTATVHGILSFVFNAALLALMINIAASAISPAPSPP